MDKNQFKTNFQEHNEDFVDFLNEILPENVCNLFNDDSSDLVIIDILENDKENNNEK